MLNNFFKKIIFGKKSLYNNIVSFLKDEKIYIADIGSTGGLDSKWFWLQNSIKRYSFDPDERAMNQEDKNCKTFKTGLWSHKCIKEIYLTKFPSASSVFKPNDAILKNFLNFDCHEVLQIESIEMESLDNILINEKSPDFIKIDTEGADLEIIIGSSRIIKNSVIGIQVEVQFMERNINSPMFGDIDSNLREKGFWLMDLKKQSWIRTNNIYSITSNPQLVWGDAVYMVTDLEAKRRCRDINHFEKKLFLCKLVSISLVFSFHDYAIDLISKFFESGFITKKEEQDLKKIVLKDVSTSPVILVTAFFWLFLALIGFLISRVLPIKRCFFEYYLWCCYKKFTTALVNLFARTGPNKTAIGDGY